MRRELALDRLGVVAEELEYEVIDEPKGGLFGIGRTEARIRARVRPISREKPTDRRRRRSSERRPSGGRKPRGEAATRSGGNDASRSAAGAEDAEGSDRPAGSPRSSSSRRRRRGRAGSGTGSGGGNQSNAGTSKEKPARQRSDERPEAKEHVDTDIEDADVEAQAEQAGAFMRSLVEAMGMTGTVTARVDEDTVLVAVDGEGLGLLVGPRGSTLQAIEELVRAVVQHGLSGRSARLRVDVGGYKERRREALAAFARQVADEVRDAGLERALEPMNPPDRKVVHDTVAELEGVTTSSEGEEPRRRVVIRPE